MMSRRTIAIFILIAAVVVVPLAIWGITNISNDQNGGENAQRIVDKDTGEIYDATVNNLDTGGSGGYQGDAKLFGLQPFTKTVLNDGGKVGYVDSIRKALWRFDEERLDGEFASLTLRPQGMDITDTRVTGTIRLGQSDTVLPITITPTEGKERAIIEINKDGSDFDGTFVFVGGLDNSETLLFTVSQKDTKTTDLFIDTYDGYREAALEYIEGLGYAVPDFKIEFTNYENPFK